MPSTYSPANPQSRFASRFPNASVLIRYVNDPKRPLRSAARIESTFRRLVRPHIGKLSIYALRRRDIVAMLDAIADENGPVMADRTLTALRSALHWQAKRDDDFTSPIIRGMDRTKTNERARKRVLDDQEIRDLWAALDELEHAPACYPAFMRTLLLTGQRRQEVSHARWEEVAGDMWTIPAARSKNKIEQTVPLTGAVKALLGPPRAGFIFSSDGGQRAFSGYSKAKRALDAKLAEIRKRDKRQPVPQWQHHDIRRTARSLMSRAGVSADVAERVIGHAIPGVRGIYDRHRYEAEKRDALERLAALVDLDVSSISKKNLNA